MASVQFDVFLFSSDPRSTQRQRSNCVSEETHTALLWQDTAQSLVGRARSL